MGCITQVGPKSIRDRGERQCQPTSSEEGRAGWHVGLLGPTHIVLISGERLGWEPDARDRGRVSGFETVR